MEENEKTGSSGGALANLEALLFAHGEPLPLKKIEKVLGAKAEEIQSLLSRLSDRLGEEDRGVQLVTVGDKVQLVTKPAFGKILQDFAKEELSEDLTPASLEALAIITYLGPISRNRIEYLRGVNSLVILRSLRLRGLVERTQDPANPNSYLYEPSFELVRHLGVKRKEDLPDYEKLRSTLRRMETEPEKSAETQA